MILQNYITLGHLGDICGILGELGGYAVQIGDDILGHLGYY